MSKEPVLVRLSHCRKRKYCVDGVKDFCEVAGIDFHEFAKNGISSEELEKIDDVFVTRLIEAARGER